MVVVAVLAAGPALFTLFLLGHYFQADLSNFDPAFDFDQYIYVREAATFAAAGFDGGYYGGNGHVARIGRFGPHGPAYAVLYGGLARLFGGWRDALAPAVNLAVVTAALLASARGLSLPVFAGLALALVLFPSAILYLPTAYQDPFQFVVGLLLALALAGLFRRAEKDGVAPPRHALAVAGLVLAAALTRPTWAALFPAVVFLGTPGRWRDMALSLVLGGAGLVLAYGLFSLTVPAWTVNAGPGYLTALAGGDPGPFVDVLSRNLAGLLDFADNRDHFLTLLLMLCATALAVGLGGFGRTGRRLAAVHLCNMLLPLAAYVAVYTGSGRHLTRLLAAHFVLTLALAARSLPGRRPALVLAVTLGGGLGLLPMTLHTYTLFTRAAYEDIFDLRPRIEAFRRTTDPALSLTLSARDPWQRTLAVAVGDLTVPFLGTPPAYGLEVYTRSGFEHPIKAGFVLLDAAGAAVAKTHTPLTVICDTPFGTLYRNDAAFGFAQPPQAVPAAR